MCKKQLSCTQNLPGSKLRIAVMASLHFDFVHAFDCLECAKNDEPDSIESQANLNIFTNELLLLSKLQ